MSTSLPRISSAQRRAALVERHLLGTNSRRERTIADVVDALGLLHSTDPSTPYLSLHARTDATVESVSTALYDEPRTLLRHTTIRRTVFVMASDVVPLAHGAYNRPLVARLRSQLVRWIDVSADVDEPAAPFLEAVERSVLTVLSSDGPQTGAQLAKLIPALRCMVDPNPKAANAKPVRWPPKPSASPTGSATFG